MEIVVNGVKRQAKELDFELAVPEHWNVYRLLDGGEVRFRVTVTKLWRLLDDSGRPAYMANGALPKKSPRLCGHVIGLRPQGEVTACPFVPTQSGSGQALSKADAYRV